MPPAEDRLDSWKEIAAYLNRSVRTARRWERHEGLPVHRQAHRKLGSVYAQKSEIDAWRDKARVSPTPVEAEKSIAVLPFANLSTDPENEYFADGLTEEITTILSKVRALRVTSRTSAKVFRDSRQGVTAIAGQLGVRYVLEGSVRRAGSRLRIAAQLIDAGSDDHLWSDTYDGSLDDVFAIQEALARVIVDALKLHLTAEERDHLAERGIDNLPAYECYLRARHEGWGWRKESIDNAVHLLRQALSIIGDNARLYAALGLAYLQYREAGLDVSDVPLAEAERCVEKVLALDPRSSAALQLRGWIHYSRASIQDAVRDLKAALALDPNNADTLLLLSNCYLISGQVSHARPLIKMLQAIDPLTPVTRCMPAFADMVDGDVAAAVGPYREMFEMDSSNPMSRLFYLWVLVLNGRSEDARDLLDGFAPQVRSTLPARLAFFVANAAAGNRGEALAELTDDIQSVAAVTDVFARLLSHGFAMLGMPREAIHWLGVAADRGFINYPFLEREGSPFRSLRGDPRFQQLLEAIRIRWERFEP